ncbi:hypothetical protein ACET3Z_002736 [Daucus carota]
MVKAEHGTGALLEQVDVIHDWGQGILAIGTFGYDPSLNAFNQQVQLIHMFENEDELDILEEEGEKEDGVEGENKICDHDQGREHNPLVLKDNVCDHDQNATKSEITILSVDDMENSECVVRDVYEKKERTTLADLFLADSDEYIDQGEVVNKPKSIKKGEGAENSKFKLPFAKFIPLMKRDNSCSSSHPRGIKKIHKMMRRMLKKKVHPELESKRQKPFKYGGNEVMEMASLLQTQDAIICP